MATIVRLSGAGILQQIIATLSWTGLVRMLQTFGAAAVAGYTIGLRIIIFGLLPSLYAGRIHTFAVRGTSQSRGSRLLRESLVAAQVMLTIVLLAAAVSVGRAFVHLMHIDRGYDLAGTVTVSVALDGTTRSNGAGIMPAPRRP